MKRFFIFGFVSALLAVNLVVGAWVYLTPAHAAERRDSEDANLDLFQNVLEKVHSDYVDSTNLTYRALVYSALKGMVSDLDPHSEFLDTRDFQQLQDDTQGAFGGLGLVVGMKDGYITVIAPMEDTPGFRAGILSGDRIVKINGQSTDNTPLDDAVNQLRGKPGTSVTITIQRPSSGMEKAITLERAIISMQMVRDINGQQDYPLGPDKIGYIRITEFGDNTGKELQTALDKLNAQGMKALILDLRWNPGGLLDEAVNVSQKFVPRGQLIVSTEGRDSIEKYYAAGSGDELNGAPIVVLVNVGTASAAEIVTGCLQDLHRAVVLGQRTFGKGLVQSIFPFNDGTALKLTTAKYYTPNRQVIEEHGITPDIYVPISDETEAALLVKRSPGGLESLPPRERAVVETVQDIQLERAEDLLKSILLYSQINQPEKMAAK
ncbi:MAG TPA: S41 family peptidase [Verrucomicrobiae bacterium]|nr:S41 family peptidase [Verrucomicrobiae bacterium]